MLSGGDGGMGALMDAAMQLPDLSELTPENIFKALSRWAHYVPDDLCVASPLSTWYDHSAFGMELDMNAQALQGHIGIGDDSDDDDDDGHARNVHGGGSSDEEGGHPSHQRVS